MRGLRCHAATPRAFLLRRREGNPREPSDCARAIPSRVPAKHSPFCVRTRTDSSGRSKNGLDRTAPKEQFKIWSRQKSDMPVEQASLVELEYPFADLLLVVVDEVSQHLADDDFSLLRPTVETMLLRQMEAIAGDRSFGPRELRDWRRSP